MPKIILQASGKSTSTRFFLVVVDESYLKNEVSFVEVQIHLPGAQAKNSKLTQMKYFSKAKIFWVVLGLNF